MDVPVIQTQRLVLRGLSESDLDAYARMCADAETMRYLSRTGQPLTADEAWRNLAFFIGHWHLRGFGMWAVQERSSGRFVGRVGFHQPGDWPGFEIGWAIVRDCWGRGYATEAAAALLPLGRSRYGQTHVISHIAPDNRASIRVAEKLGETVEDEYDLNGMHVLRYGIDLI